MKHRDIKLTFGFVPMGQVAPDPVPQGEVWVDVGNRVAPRVLDHHGGDTYAWSATQLIFEKIDEIIIPYFKDSDTMRIILHVQPDLDAICGAWLIKKRIVEGVDLNSVKEVHLIIQLVTENDQGLVKTNNAITCWPIIMRSLIGRFGRDEVDQIIINSWFALFDETLKILQMGGSFADAAEKIITPELRVALAQEQKDYEHDLSRGLKFQVMLPLLKKYSLKKCNETLNQGDECRVLCDALLLHNPTSLLFKELSRGDIKKSMQGSGFSLLVVSWDIQISDGRVVQRYIISTDPLTGFHLNGLGRLLENKEQEKEDQLGFPYLPGRERVEIGKGRFGWNVVSPWYDGRGHNFTIVDSPSIQIDGGICISQLSRQELLEVVWAYGDPGLFIQVMDAELIGFIPSFQSQYVKRSENLSTLNDILIEPPRVFCSWTSEMLQFASDVFIQESAGNIPKENQDYSQQERNWEFFSDTNILIRSTKLASRIYTMNEATTILAKIRNCEWRAPAFRSDFLSASSYPTCLVKLNVNSADLTFSRESPAFKLILYRAASGLGAGFPQEGEYENSSSIHSTMTVDGRSQFAITEDGYIYLNSTLSYSNESDNPTRISQGGECVVPLLALTLSIKSKVTNLSEQFLRHLHCRKTSKLAKFLLEDRERLFWLEHKTQVRRVSEVPIIQKIYELLKSHMEISERFLHASKQINNLSDTMKEARANLLSKLSFIITTAVPPLLLTFSFFGGRFLDKDFQEKYRLFVPEKWLVWISQHLGLNYNWISFLFILAALYTILICLWFILGRKQKKNIKKARI